MDDVNERLVFVDLFVGDLDRERDDAERGDPNGRAVALDLYCASEPDEAAELIADRLSLAVARTGVSDQDVAIRAGIARSSLSNMIRRLRTGDKTTLTVDTCARIARACGVSAGWLAFGEGSP